MILVLAIAGITTAWVIIILRAAMTTTRIERQLLATIVAMCFIYTLYNPYVIYGLNMLIGPEFGFHTRHTICVMTAAVVVAFATAPTHPSHIKWWIVAGVGTLAVMIIVDTPVRFMNILHGTTIVTTVTEVSGTAGSRSIVYFVFLGGYCVASALATIARFIVAARAIANTFTKVSLWLLCGSLLLGGISWVATVVSIIVGQQIWVQYDFALDGLAAFFLAVAVLVALGAALSARIQLGRTARRLYPLWLALTDTVPGVVLVRAQRSGRRRYGIQRLVVELRDCFLVLGGYLDRGDVDRIRQQVARSALSGSSEDAMVTALSLHQAQANKIAGKPPAAHRIALLPASSAATLDDDLAELIHIADAYRVIAHHQAGQHGQAGSDRISD